MHILVYCEGGAQAGELVQVAESATRDKNYPTALRVANNAIKQFSDLATAYFTER